MSLHGAHGLHELAVYDDPVRLRGESLESLWRVTMTLDVKTPTRDAQFSRLLIWRSIREKCTTGAPRGGPKFGLVVPWAVNCLFHIVMMFPRLHF
jgi:hypothetical protein